MPVISIVFGLVLIAIGVEGYTNTLDLFKVTKLQSPTSLIPAGFGALLVLLGLVGFAPNLRKHAMHAAAMVALLGFVGGAAMGFPKLSAALKGDELVKNPSAVKMQSLMGAVCGIFLALCVKSFIDARRRRMQQPV